MENKTNTWNGPWYQAKIRERLHEVNVKDPKSQTQLAKVIGISPATIHDFMVDGLDITYKSMCIIEKYLKEQEKGV